MSPVRAARAVLAALVLALVAACGPPPPAVAPSDAEGAILWQDLYDGTPELMAVLHPQALLRDSVYGPLYKSALRAAIARGAPAQLSMLEALDDAEEVLLAARPRMQDATLVARGVRADHDPARILDGEKAPRWRLVREAGRLREYQRATVEGATSAATLFVHGRTWTIVTGAARERAPQVLSHPARRPEPRIDRAALVSVRIDGRELVSAVPALQNGRVQKVGQGLVSVSILLLPEKEGVVLKLGYSSDDATAWAHRTIEQVLDALRERGGKWAFLKDVSLVREPGEVVLRSPLPKQLLDALPQATGADLAL